MSRRAAPTCGNGVIQRLSCSSVFVMYLLKKKGGRLSRSVVYECRAIGHGSRTLALSFSVHLMNILNNLRQSILTLLASRWSSNWYAFEKRLRIVLCKEWLIVVNICQFTLYECALCVCVCVMRVRMRNFIVMSKGVKVLFSVTEWLNTVMLIRVRRRRLTEKKN